MTHPTQAEDLALTYSASVIAAKHGAAYDEFTAAARAWYVTHDPDGTDPDFMAASDVLRVVARDFPGGLAAFAAQVKA